MRIGNKDVDVPDGDTKLARLFTIQQIQQDAFLDAGINVAPYDQAGIDALTGKRAMQLIEEVVELVRHIGYKEHRCTTPSASSEHEAMLEWADIFKFLIIIAQIRGWESKDLVSAFVTKTIVADSYMRERMLVDDDADEWVAFDLDDVLADYTGYFCQMMKAVTGREIDPTDVDHSKSIGEQYGIGRKEWEVIKERVRSEGGFARFKPLAPGLEAVKVAGELGFNVLLITNRPVHEYPRLYSDTVLWLNQQEVCYHSLVFGSSKVMKICQGNRQLAGRIRLAFDDHPANVKEFQDVGVNAVLVSARENNHEGVVTLDAMSEYIKTILGPR